MMSDFDDENAISHPYYPEEAYWVDVPEGWRLIESDCLIEGVHELFNASEVDGSPCTSDCTHPNQSFAGLRSLKYNVYVVAREKNPYRKL